MVLTQGQENKSLTDKDKLFIYFSQPNLFSFHQPWIVLSLYEDWLIIITPSSIILSVMEYNWLLFFLPHTHQENKFGSTLMSEMILIVIRSALISGNFEHVWRSHFWGQKLEIWVWIGWHQSWTKVVFLMSVLSNSYILWSRVETVLVFPDVGL